MVGIGHLLVCRLRAKPLLCGVVVMSLFWMLACMGAIRLDKEVAVLARRGGVVKQWEGSELLQIETFDEKNRVILRHHKDTTHLSLLLADGTESLINSSPDFFAVAIGGDEKVYAAKSNSVDIYNIEIASAVESKESDSSTIGLLEITSAQTISLDSLDGFNALRDIAAGPVGTTALLYSCHAQDGVKEEIFGAWTLRDTCVALMEDSGHFFWQTRISTGSADIGQAIEYDAVRRRFLVAGYTSGVFPGYEERMNCFVISLGGDGQLQWLRQMGEPFPSVEIPSALAVDSNGSVFVAGTRKLATESGLRSVGRFLYAHGSNGDTLADWVQADLPFGASAVPLDIEVVETGKVLVGGYFNYRNPMRILSSGAYQEDPIVEVFQLSRDTSVETEWVIQRSDIEVRPMTEGTNDIRVVDIEMMGTGEVLMACTLGVKQSKDSQIPLRNDSVVVFWDPDAIDEAMAEE